MGSGEMAETEYIAFLKIVFRNMADVSVAGAVHFTFMDWRHFHEILSAGHDTYDALLNVCVWVKGNGGMGSLYRSEHEHVFVWRVSNQRAWTLLPNAKRTPAVGISVEKRKQ